MKKYTIIVIDITKSKTFRYFAFVQQPCSVSMVFKATVMSSDFSAILNPVVYTEILISKPSFIIFKHISILLLFRLILFISSIGLGVLSLVPVRCYRYPIGCICITKSFWSCQYISFSKLTDITVQWVLSILSLLKNGQGSVSISRQSFQVWDSHVKDITVAWQSDLQHGDPCI